MSRVRAIGGWTALVAITTAIVVSWQVAERPARAQVAPEPGLEVVDDVTAIAEGRLLYLETCASCHGADGQGIVLEGPGDEIEVLGPSLEGDGAASWHFYLNTGRMPLSAPGEPSYRQPVMFSDEQIAALIAYGESRFEGREIPDIVSDFADVQAGWELFVNNCAACHGVTGSGGAVGPGAVAPAILDIDSTLLAEAILVGPGTMPRFDWTDEQLSAVATYVETLREGEDPGGFSIGGFGPVPEGLIAGFVGLAILVLVARFVAGQPPGRRAPVAAERPATSAPGTSEPADDEPGRPG